MCISLWTVPHYLSKVVIKDASSVVQCAYTPLNSNPNHAVRQGPHALQECKKGSIARAAALIWNTLLNIPN